MCIAVGTGPSELVPCREPTEAERYELHQRWWLSGGSFNPGPNPEIDAKMADRPDPVGRSAFESDAYSINSDWAILIPLIDMITELVKDE